MSLCSQREWNGSPMVVASALSVRLRRRWLHRYSFALLSKALSVLWNRFPICLALQSTSSLAVMIHLHYMQISSFKEEGNYTVCRFSTIYLLYYTVCRFENPLKEPGEPARQFGSSGKATEYVRVLSTPSLSLHWTLLLQPWYCFCLFGLLKLWIWGFAGFFLW